MRDESQLPDDLSTAHELILVQSERLIEFSEKYGEAVEQIQNLQALVKKLLSGKKRERFDNPDQMLLSFQEDPEWKAAIEAARREAEQELVDISYKRAKRRKEQPPRTDAFPEHLRREEVIHPLSPADQALADSGREVRRTLLKEVICFRRPELYVKAHYQLSLEPLSPAQIESALEALPADLGEKGRIEASVAAAITAAKFDLHLPYYRQQNEFASSGWTPSRSTLDYTQDLVAEAVEALPRLMRQRVRESFCVSMDDTAVTLLLPSQLPEIPSEDLNLQRLAEKMIEAKRKGEKSLEAKMWAYSGSDDAPYDIFDFRVSRHRDGPAEFLRAYTGYVMADCYSGNLSVILEPGASMTRLACWSHARRKAYEAREVDTACSSPAIALMNRLYEIERDLAGASVQQRTETRQRESRAVLEQLRRLLDGPLVSNLLPSSRLAQAFSYVKQHWTALNRYIEDGRLPIDNNHVERLMRQVAIGRKNWLFVGSLRAGVRNASLMTLVNSAKRHDLDVEQYLEDVITKLNRGTASPETLLPDVWKLSHPDAVRRYRSDERRDKAEASRARGAERKVRRAKLAGKLSKA